MYLFAYGILLGGSPRVSFHDLKNILKTDIHAPLTHADRVRSFAAWLRPPLTSSASYCPKWKGTGSSRHSQCLRWLSFLSCPPAELTEDLTGINLADLGFDLNCAVAGAYDNVVALIDVQLLGVVGVDLNVGFRYSLVQWLATGSARTGVEVFKWESKKNQPIW